MSNHSRSSSGLVKLLLVGFAATALFVTLNRLSSTPPGIENAHEETPSAAPENSPATPKPKRPEFLKDEQSKSEHMKSLARQSGGNFDKLSSEDQKFIQTLSMGHGREMIRMEAESLKMEQNQPGKAAK